MMKFYGMSSNDAMIKHGSSVRNYRASEGKTTYVSLKGPIKNCVKEILGGIRSACSYTDSKTLKTLKNNSVFIKCNRTVDNI